MISVEEVNLKEILPSSGPSITEVKKYLKKYKNEHIIIKCGGSILKDPKLFKNLIQDISILKKLKFKPCVIHGGGTKITDKLLISLIN